MRDALNATGRPIVFSMCESGISDPWVYGREVGAALIPPLDASWPSECRTQPANSRRQGKACGSGMQVANMWRTTFDISPGWEHVLANLDSNIGLARFAGPGGWNDPDMLEVVTAAQ